MSRAPSNYGRNLESPHYRYNQQKAQADYRNEAWAITLEEWTACWDESGKWDQRGRGKGKYRMTRIDALYPWQLDNIEITSRKGRRVRPLNAPPVTSRKPIKHGDGHAISSKEVIINGVTYESQNKAAMALGVSPSMIRYRACGNEDYPNWTYVDPANATSKYKYIKVGNRDPAWQEENNRLNRIAALNKYIKTSNREMKKIKLKRHKLQVTLQRTQKSIITWDRNIDIEAANHKALTDELKTLENKE